MSLKQGKKDTKMRIRAFPVSKLYIDFHLLSNEASFGKNETTQRFLILLLIIDKINKIDLIEKFNYLF